MVCLVRCFGRRTAGFSSPGSRQSTARGKWRACVLIKPSAIFIVGVETAFQVEKQLWTFYDPFRVVKVVKPSVSPTPLAPLPLSVGRRRDVDVFQ